MYWTPGVSSRFRREDIADCLLVPFDFFPLLCQRTRGESVICVGSMGIFSPLLIRIRDSILN